MSDRSRESTASARGADFAQRVLRWFDRHGRHDLPWQEHASPYRVWISEIMLQQTQVSTVIPYFQRFMARFPDPQSLAAADLDEVLHLWSGLGYYARARNLHAAARIVVGDYGGRFPDSLEQCAALPGIGRSTAGAILSLGYGRRQAILDGNVKRVLARFHGVEGWAGQASVARVLWDLAESNTPDRRVADYNQAMMDLGATLCTRRQPRCDECPVSEDCVARRHGLQARLPSSRPGKALPARRTRMLIIEAQRRVLLVRRPPAGIWGGLWSLPECNVADDLRGCCRERFGLEVTSVRHWPAVRHTFSHFHLEIEPAHLAVSGSGPVLMDADGQVWYNTGAPPDLGLAAPVSRLLNRLREGE